MPCNKTRQLAREGHLQQGNILAYPQPGTPDVAESADPQLSADPLPGQQRAARCGSASAAKADRRAAAAGEARISLEQGDRWMLLKGIARLSRGAC